MDFDFARLRDISLEREKEFKDRLNVLEGDNRPDVEMRVENAQIKKDLNESEIQIQEIKSALDDALGAAEMVEQLSELNTDLSNVCLSKKQAKHVSNSPR